MIQLNIFKQIISRISKEYHFRRLIRSFWSEQYTNHYLAKSIMGGDAITLYAFFQNSPQMRDFFLKEKGRYARQAFNRILLQHCQKLICAFIEENNLTHTFIQACQKQDIYINSLNDVIQHCYQKSINPYFLFEIWYQSITKLDSYSKFLHFYHQYTIYLSKYCIKDNKNSLNT